MDEKNKTDKGFVTDLVFISFFTLLPMVQILHPDLLESGFWLQFNLVAFFVASLPYIGRIKAYVIRIALSLSIGILGGLIYFDGFHGFIFLFVIMFMSEVLAPAILGFFAAHLYKEFERKWIGNFLSKSVKSILLVSLVVASVFIVVTGIKSEEFLFNEIDKRLSLAKSITTYYGATKTKELNNRLAIEAGITEGIYEHSEGETLTHGYEGNIKIVSDEDGISLIYYDVPNEEICHQFYNMNSPSTYGFSEIYVDDKSIKTASNSQAAKIRKNELCYSSNKDVTLRFTATFEELEFAIRLKGLIK